MVGAERVKQEEPELITSVQYAVRYFEGNTIAPMPNRATAWKMYRRLLEHHIACEVIRCRVTRGSWETDKEVLHGH